MKIGRGRLLVDGDVSVPILHAGRKRQLTFDSKERPSQLQLWVPPDGAAWRETPRYSQDYWTALWTKDGWTRTDATAEELDAIWAEVRRVRADPDRQSRKAQSEKNISKAHIRSKLRHGMARVKRAMAELLAAGVDPAELEDQLVSLVKETIIETVQES